MKLFLNSRLNMFAFKCGQRIRWILLCYHIIFYPSNSSFHPFSVFNTSLELWIHEMDMLYQYRLPSQAQKWQPHRFCFYTEELDQCFLPYRHIGSSSSMCIIPHKQKPTRYENNLQNNSYNFYYLQWSLDTMWFCYRLSFIWISSEVFQ